MAQNIADIKTLSSSGLPEPGQIVIVRQRPFVVLDIQASQLPPTTVHQGIGSNQHLVKLSSAEDEGLGEELEVIWEIEPGVSCLEKAQLPELKEFDPPKTFEAFLDAVTWGSVSSADDKALQAPFRSSVDIDDYQLDPVVRALSMPRVNLLIADDVGLGKTIETGLVAQELILRHRARTILVVCPSSIQVQWKEEMRDKFGLEFRIVDSSLLSDLRRRRGIHVNPWSHFPRLITSIDFLKRERPMRLFRETLPSGDQPTYPRPYDLLIVDEAHNVAPSGGGKYATESMRTSAIRTLSPFFEHKLFLTATPHNGYSESFSALLELLDNQRFARVGPPNKAQLDAVMVRRMKSELEKRWDGSRRFAKRLVKFIEVPYTDKERNVHQALKHYTTLREESAKTAEEKFATRFVLKLLKKRLFSCPAAFASTLEKHAHTVGAGAMNIGSKAWQRQLEEVDNDQANDEEYEENALEAVEVASRNVSALAAEEKKLLKELRDYAVAASSLPDSKAKKLITWLKQKLMPNGKWSSDRVLIFTEYRATQKWLHNLLAGEGLAEQGRLEIIYGGSQLEDREKIKAAFQADPADSPVRILLATDAASEGLNLQNHCWQLIHYEIPWNPNRMEQRNGRVDRHGQKNPEVHVHHFVGSGFNETKEAQSPGDLDGDLEFLMRAAIKVENIREDLGKVGPVIAQQVEEAMLGRRKTLDTSRAERESEPVRKILKFERNLRELLKKYEEQLRSTERELHISPENIQNLVEMGLALAGQPSLRPAEAAGIWPDPSKKRTVCPVFHLPVLTGSWALCADGLAHPHTKKIRPIVFDRSLAVGRDDVVVCHLNHRLVQMCLRLLRAEVWSQGINKKLNRFTTRMVPDTVLQTPAVIIHGRLLVLGGDSQRVHEEIIMAGGVLKEGRFTRMNVGEVNAAYAAGTSQEAPGFVEDRLKELWPTIEKQVIQSLEARKDDRTENLQKFLDERSEHEVDQLTAIMKELENSIRETLSKVDDPQLELELNDIEKRQRKSDFDSLRLRLSEIPKELADETEHLKARYRNPQPRLFPLAVTFLVPHRASVQLTQGGGR
jgi:superfamily II DNA or RNA helicase